MRFKEFYLLENDTDHQDALDETGFWGKQGAGCIFFSRPSKRFMVAHRSNYVEQPNTWGTFGGAIDSGEDIEDALRREVEEEVGYEGSFDLSYLFTFKSGSFRYHNYVAIVDEEFEPQLNWENQGYEWVEFGDWPEPLHFGMENILQQSSNKLRHLTSS